MAYKGIDLDLRTPRPPVLSREVFGHPERNGHGSGSLGVSAGAIAVDEDVLACCNCAYDVARFHASSEVRLEHLLHALTRVVVAAEFLTELGIRVDSLRRETAVAIAAEAPSSLLASEGNPHASAAFEDVLRRASEHAAKRHVPAGLEDLLRTVLSGGPGSPAASLLSHAAGDPQRLERWRDAPLRAVFAAPAPEARAEMTSDLSSSAAQAMFQRLDVMEATLRALQGQVAADRQALGDMLRDVDSGVQALRGASGDLGDRHALLDLTREVQSSMQALRRESSGAAAERTEAAERVQALKVLVDTKLTEIGATVSERLARLDNMGPLGEHFASLDKIAAAGESWRDLGEAVRGFDATVNKQTLETVNRVTGAISERLEKAETGLSRLQQDTERYWGATGERQIALDASVRAHLQGAEEAAKKHDKDLGEVYQALVKLGANQQTLGDNFTAWRIETGGDIGIVNNGLRQLEQTVLGLFGQLGGELQALQQRTTSVQTASRIRGGFKRWLYGTDSVFGWRGEADGSGAAAGRSGEHEAEVDVVQRPA